jgi:drug/metabolite transporter (DMT)-like permease
VAFACFLGLQQRLGPGPASTVGVATPVLALIVSAVLEGYVPTLWTLAGVGLAAGGSALALGLKRLQKPP